MPYQRQIAAALRGDTLTLSLLRDESEDARQAAFDEQAPLAERVLDAVASDVMRPAVAEAMIRGNAQLRQEVIDLAGAQMGDVAIGQAAGRDIVTINIYVGTTEHQ